MRLLRTLLLVSAIVSWTSYSVYGQVAESQEGKKYARFYIGAGGIFSRYRIPYDKSTYDEGLLAPVLTGGYHISPKLALQISWARYATSFRSQGYVYIKGDPSNIGFLSEESTHNRTAIPVLLRYATGVRLQHRVQLDLLVGLTFVRASYQDTAYLTDSTKALVSQSTTGEQANRTVLTLGLGIRTRLSKHLELVGDGGFNRTLNSKGTNPNSFQPMLAAGLRYRFNIR